jgi:hypothetical protein
LRTGLFRCAFEGELGEGGIGCVVAQTGVVEVDCRFLDGGYYKVADCGDILYLLTEVEYSIRRENIRDCH